MRSPAHRPRGVCDVNSQSSNPTTWEHRGELGSLAALGIGAESEILLRFSLKESIYKAIHPFVRRYVAFQEVRRMAPTD